MSDRNIKLTVILDLWGKEGTLEIDLRGATSTEAALII